MRLVEHGVNVDFGSPSENAPQAELEPPKPFDSWKVRQEKLLRQAENHRLRAVERELQQHELRKAAEKKAAREAELRKRS
jgi:hypothetical protein